MGVSFLISEAEPWLLDAFWVNSGLAHGDDGRGGTKASACFPCTVNNQLRTGADKGNPTV